MAGVSKASEPRNWVFVKNGRACFLQYSAEADPRSKVKLSLERFRDKSLKQYISIEIEIGEKLEFSGRIESDRLNLEANLNKLLLYAGDLDRSDIPDIRLQIEKNFSNIPLSSTKDKGEEDSQNNFLGVYNMFCDYFFNIGSIPENHLFNITVVEFKDMISDSDYYFLSYREIKEYFKANEWIKFNVGRTDNIVKIKGKPVRVISFFEKAVHENWKKMDLKPVTKATEVTSGVQESKA